MTEQAVITFLKYAGLIVAAVAAIWGTTSDVRIEKDGKKLLSTGGYVLTRIRRITLPSG